MFADETSGVAWVQYGYAGAHGCEDDTDLGTLTLPPEVFAAVKLHPAD